MSREDQILNKLNFFLDIGEINNEKPDEANLILGSIYEYSRELNLIDALNKGIYISSLVDLGKYSDEDKMTFYYNLSNAWSYKKIMLQELNNSLYWNFESEELVQEILNCRKALYYSKNSKNLNRKCEILTNLGNNLSHLGRFSEAVECWSLAVNIIDDFPMAIGNLGFGLFHYAQVLYDSHHKALFLKESNIYLKKAIKLDGIYPEAKTDFLRLSSVIESKVDITFLNAKNDFKNTSIGNSFEEKKYRKWCVENKLFLNPLNDIFQNNIVAHDILCLPTIIVNNVDSNIYKYHTIFNQIKQEFCSARYLFYDSVVNQTLHFSDRDTVIIDLFDYSLHSYNVEKTKLAFRTLYSILDKIAYLINIYLNLGYNSYEVTYRKIWYSKKGKLNPLIEQSQNWALRGLFWLYKDFFEKEELHSYLEPEAKELSTIRNFIEHKSFKVIELGSSGISEDGFTYIIGREHFIEKTLKLMKTIRAGIIYTSLFINIEETIKDYDADKLGKVQLSILDDNFKI